MFVPSSNYNTETQPAHFQYDKPLNYEPNLIKKIALLALKLIQFIYTYIKGFFWSEMPSILEKPTLSITPDNPIQQAQVQIIPSQEQAPILLKTPEPEPLKPEFHAPVKIDRPSPPACQPRKIENIKKPEAQPESPLSWTATVVKAISKLLEPLITNPPEVDPRILDTHYIYYGAPFDETPPSKAPIRKVFNPAKLQPKKSVYTFNEERIKSLSSEDIDKMSPQERRELNRYIRKLQDEHLRLIKHEPKGFLPHAPSFRAEALIASNIAKRQAEQKIRIAKRIKDLESLSFKGPYPIIIINDMKKYDALLKEHKEEIQRLKNSKNFDVSKLEFIPELAFDKKANFIKNRKKLNEAIELVSLKIAEIKELININ